MSTIDTLKKLAAEKRAELAELERDIAEIEDVDEPKEIVADGPAFEAEQLDMEWLVGGMVADRTVTMLVADPGIGKSTFVAQLTLMLSTGRRFLDADTQARPTLTVSAEGSRAAFRARWRMARGALGIEPPRQWFIQAGHVKDFKIGSRRLEEMILRAEARLVVLDTIGYFATWRENNAEEWKANVMIPLREIVARTGSSFLLVHHQPKKTADNADERTGRGTSAMLADVDHFWVLNEVPGEPALRELVVRKNKYGRGGALRVAFDQQSAIFRVVA